MFPAAPHEFPAAPDAGDCPPSPDRGVSPFGSGRYPRGAPVRLSKRDKSRLLREEMLRPQAARPRAARPQATRPATRPAPAKEAPGPGGDGDFMHRLQNPVKRRLVFS